MHDMPRPRLPYLACERNRHGTLVWYFRRGKGARIRLRGDYGSVEFREAYEAALVGNGIKHPTRAKSGSLAWLVAQYRETSAWSSLAPATRRARDNIFSRVIASAGKEEFSAINRPSIMAAMDSRKDTPAAAKNFLKTMRGLFAWAVDAEYVRTDPTAGIKSKLPRSNGFHVWTQAEVDKFEARWPIGTRERLALCILKYTMLRRGDAAKLGRQHIKDGVISIQTEKTGSWVHIPVHAELAAAIDALPKNGLALIAKADGTPMVKEGFGNWFKEACVASGVPGSAHGLRKYTATYAAESGATEKELDALAGWTDGGKTAQVYTRNASRKILAKEAAEKMWGKAK